MCRKRPQAYLAYHKPLRTRADRAQGFRQREEPWLTAQEGQAREVILALIEKYELGGLKEMTNAGVFCVSPFREMGEVRGVINRFGGNAQRLRNAVDEIQRRLYAA